MGRRSRDHAQRKSQRKVQATPTAADALQAPQIIDPSAAIVIDLPEAIAPTHLQFKIQQAIELPHSYKERKSSQAGFLSFFAPSNPERLEKINFITLISSNVADIPAAAEIIDGAYIYVLHDIENSYHKAWWSKDPKASQLYNELSDRTSGRTTDEKLSCLHQLKINLQDENMQQKIKLESEKISEILTNIDKQIETLQDDDKLNGSPNLQLGSNDSVQAPN